MNVGHSNRGVTLVELLLVIAIIGLLVCLSVPAIQASRESARSAQCANNQRQFGVAFTSVESRTKVFPAAFTLRLKGPLTTDPDLQMHNFMIDLLPFLEEDSINSQYHRNALFCAPENKSAIGAVLSVAICPSAPRSENAATTTFVPSLTVGSDVRKRLKEMYVILDKQYTTSFQGGVTDYSVPGGVAGDLARQLGYTVTDNNSGLASMFPSPLSQSEAALTLKIAPIWTKPGVSDFSIRMRAAQIKDGLSHTLMLVEVAGRPDHYRLGHRHPIGEPLESAWADPFTTLRIDGTRVSDESEERCVLQCDNDDEIYSFHPAGINCLFADGHVTQLSPSIDQRLVLALITPDRGDNVDGLASE